MKERFKLIDSIEVCHKDKDGNIISKRIINNSRWNKLLSKLGLRHNSVTKYGFAEVAGLIVSDVGGTDFDYIAIGTGNTAASVNDSELDTEIKRKVSTGTRIEVDYPNDTAQWVATFSSADNLSGNSAVCEIGILNADSSGTLLLRQVYTPVDNCNWDLGDTLQITVKCQIKQGS